MPKYFVELSARLYFDGEIEAEDEAMAIDLAWDQADENARWDSIDWDVDYVELLESPAVDENQGELF
jgi:hypothetical protein